MKWDFSKSHKAEDVPFPPGLFDRDINYYVVGVNGLVKIQFDETHKFEEKVESVGFLAAGASNHNLIGVDCIFENKSPDEIFAIASRLARYWNLDESRLRQWYEKTRRGEDVRDIQIMRKEPDPSGEIRILGHNGRYALLFVGGWLTPELRAALHQDLRNVAQPTSAESENGKR